MQKYPASPALLCVAIAISLAGASAHAASIPSSSLSASASNRVTQLIVQPKRFDLAQAQRLDESSLAGLSQAAGVTLTHVRAMSGQAQILRLPHAMSADEAQAYARRLVEAGVAIYAEPDRWMYPMRAPNDPLYADKQWHYQKLVTGMAYGANSYTLNLPGAWDITTGNSSVVVAVIDSGLLPHNDIDSNIMDGVGRVAPGYDFISIVATDPDSGVVYPPNDGDGRDPDPTDPGDWQAADDPMCGNGEDKNSSWHGTHVAGTIGALSNNNLGVAAVAWDVTLLPVRVLGKCGGLTSDIVDGMRWAAGISVPGVPDNAHPARVLNMSLGGEGVCETVYQSAINDVRAKGAVVVVAAGNENQNVANSSPANCAGIISVAATDSQGQRAYYSNYGKEVNIAAPGGDSLVGGGIYSTEDGGARAPLYDNVYGSKQGTSMATPHVAGLVALMLARDSGLTPDKVLTTLQATATPFPAYAGATAKDTFLTNEGYCGGAPCDFDCTTSTCGAGVANAEAAIASLGKAKPDPFSFVAQGDVVLGAVIVSNSITVSGINVAAPVSVSNGEYSLGCAADGFTSKAGSVNNGQTVCVRHTSANTPATKTDTTLTIGGVVGVFSSTTVPPDTKPDAFAFAPVSGVTPGSVVTSAPVTIRGINTKAPVSIVNGEYSIGCLASGFSSQPGTISNGQTVCVRHTAAQSNGASFTSTLNVGGVSAGFTSTTATPVSGGGGSMGLLTAASLFGFAAWRRLRGSRISRDRALR